jgi:predicted RNA-binding protein with PUA-like domain
MNYWLLKSEPETWSWQQQVKRGAKGEMWNGVRNYQAAKFMKAMKKGDLGFFYHSGKEKAIVGIVEVSKEHYPDPTDDSQRFVAVTVRAQEPLKKPVTLQQIKAEESLSDLLLVRQGRLSVMPINTNAWKKILSMAK